ncbi:hypothetical protein GCM10010245_22120 [Streptomyces spectabilis]|nr:hypothetical protein GCM10010245_22120 [Streptomyces spectabilis]
MAAQASGQGEEAKVVHDGVSFRSREAREYEVGALPGGPVVAHRTGVVRPVLARGRACQRVAR